MTSVAPSVNNSSISGYLMAPMGWYSTHVKHVFTAPLDGTTCAAKGTACVARAVQAIALLILSPFVILFALSAAVGLLINRVTRVEVPAKDLTPPAPENGGGQKPPESSKSEPAAEDLVPPAPESGGGQKPPESSKSEPAAEDLVPPAPEPAPEIGRTGKLAVEVPPIPGVSLEAVRFLEEGALQFVNQIDGILQIVDRGQRVSAFQEYLTSITTWLRDNREYERKFPRDSGAFYTVKELRRQADLLSQLSKGIIPVLADGNCLFRSISTLLHTQQIQQVSHDKLREQAVAWMQENFTSNLQLRKYILGSWDCGAGSLRGHFDSKMQSLRDQEESILALYQAKGMTDDEYATALGLVASERETLKVFDLNQQIVEICIQEEGNFNLQPEAQAQLNSAINAYFEALKTPSTHASDAEMYALAKITGFDIRVILKQGNTLRDDLIPIVRSGSNDGKVIHILFDHARKHYDAIIPPNAPPLVPPQLNPPLPSNV